jgi:hypothetical protein
MKINAQNTKVIQSSIQFNLDKTAVTFQANTELVVEGNPYAEIEGTYIRPRMVTPVTLFDLICAVENIPSIEGKAQEQAEAWVSINYPQV